MRKLTAKAIDLADDFLAYILTIVGILLSNYLPMLRTTGTIDVSIDLWRIGISAMVALIIIGRQEAIATDGDTAKARAGRRRNFAPRMANALAQGIAWNTIVQLAS